MVKSGELIENDRELCVFCKLGEILNNSLVAVAVISCNKYKTVNACLLHALNLFYLLFPGRLKVSCCNDLNAVCVLDRCFGTLDSLIKCKAGHFRAAANREKVVSASCCLKLNVLCICIIVDGSVFIERSEKKGVYASEFFCFTCKHLNTSDNF